MTKRSQELARQLAQHAELLSLGAPESPPAGTLRGPLSETLPTGWTRNAGPTLFLTAAVTGTAAAGLATALGFGGPESSGFLITVFRVLAAWVLAFLPGWLLVRFLRLRLPVIWDRFVLTIARLDDRSEADSPPPPSDSIAFRVWQSRGTTPYWRTGKRYSEVFDARYGPGASLTAVDWRRRVRVQTVAPSLSVTTVLSVGWTLFLLAPPPVAGSGGGDDWRMVGFAFLGAYLYDLNFVVRTYARGDYPADIYRRLLAHVLFATGVGAALWWPLSRTGIGPIELGGLLFIVGAFPYSRVLDRLLSLRTSWPTSVEPSASLSKLTGLDLYYQRRLRSEGVSDLEALVHADVLSLSLNTNIPMGRLIDWIDQAYLQVYVGQLSRDMPAVLADSGIRTASQLVDSFASGGDDAAEPAPAGPARLASGLLEAEVDNDELRLVLDGLRTDAGFQRVLRWRAN